jgi:hypothetical protein
MSSLKPYKATEAFPERLCFRASKRAEISELAADPAGVQLIPPCTILMIFVDASPSSWADTRHNPAHRIIVNITASIMAAAADGYAFPLLSNPGAERVEAAAGTTLNDDADGYISILGLIFR